MNQEGILVPKKIVSRNIKPGQSRPFWERDWDVLNLISEYDYTQNNRKVKEQLAAIKYEPSDKNVYMEVSLKDKSKSKTKQPDRLWKKADLELVESKDATTLTLSGSGDSIQKFEQIISGASYAAAKEGKDISGVDRNMYRELYAVSAVRDLGEEFDERTDEYVKKELSNGTTSIDCLIELRANLNFDDYDKYFKLINSNVEGQIFKRDTELFFNNMSYLASLKAYDIKGLLGSKAFRFIRVIKRQPTFSEQRSPSNVDVTNSTTLKPATDVIVGIVDSGVDNSLLNSLRVNHLKTTSLKENKSHGTFVASRALFGHDLTALAHGKADTLEPIGKFFDIQVLGEKNINGSPRLVVEDDQDLIGAIKKVVKRHPDVKIYNISIAEEYAADPKNISDTTVALDELSHESDVLFIVSAGNHQAHKILGYDKIFSRSNGHDIGVAAPGDSANSLTIGAVAYEVGDDAMTRRKFFPSPFTRMGNVRSNVKKPELVEEGGNYISDSSLDDAIRDIRSKEKYGVVGLSDTSLVREIGTSFSTPLVTHQAILLQDYINNQLSSTLNVSNNYSNLIRAMLVHSTAFVSQPSLTSSSNGMASGFGLPNFETLFATGNDRITMVYCDEVDLADKVHTLRFQLPDFLLKNKSSYVLTLAYNPPVDKNFNDYNMLCLKPSLRVVLPEYTDKETGEIKQDTKTISHGTSWRNSRNERGTICHYTSVNKTGLDTNEVELYIQMKTHKKFEEEYSKEDRKGKLKVTQPYAVMISVIDGSSSGKLRSEVLNSEQFELVTRSQVQVAK